MHLNDLYWITIGGALPGLVWPYPMLPVMRSCRQEAVQLVCKIWSCTALAAWLCLLNVIIYGLPQIPDSPWRMQQSFLFYKWNKPNTTHFDFKKLFFITSCHTSSLNVITLYLHNKAFVGISKVPVSINTLQLLIITWDNIQMNRSSLNYRPLKAWQCNSFDDSIQIIDLYWIITVGALPGLDWADPYLKHHHIDGLVQDCINSSALALLLQLLQSCSKPSIFSALR